MNFIECQGLTKCFGAKRAVDGVNFTLPKYSITGLIGANGAGKTTLFSLIAGFLKPDSGNVKVNYENNQSSLGILPQDAGFLSHLTIREQFIFYGQLMGMTKSEAASETNRVIELVDLADAADQEGSVLSHGMHKRMAIAQAFMGNPSLIMLDEPTAGLDPVNAEKVRRLIVSGKGKHTFIVSSHNLDEIADLCDRVLIIDGGKLLENKEIAQFTNENEIFSFTLKEQIDEAKLTLIKSQTFVNDAALSDSGFNLHVEIENKDENLGGFISFLAVNSIQFKEMKQGNHLKEEFLKLINKD